MTRIAIVPARAGSKGIAHKNVKLLNGKPLIAYTFDSANNSKQFDHILLSTNSAEIADIGKQIGFDVPFLRPEYLATDEAKSIDVVLNTIEYLQSQKINPTEICLLQPTSPFRHPDLIHHSFDKFYSSGADSLISVRKVPHTYNPHWVFEKDERGMLFIATKEDTIIPRRQDLPDCFYRDGQIYITSINVLTQQKSFIGKNLTYIENTYPGSAFNLDTQDDWTMAELFVQQNMKHDD